MRVKTSKIQYLLVCCLLLFTSGSSAIAVNKTCIIIWCAGSLLYYLHTQVRTAQQFLPLLGILCLVSFTYYFINNAADEQTYFGFFVYIVGAFSTVKIAGRMLPKIIVDVVYVAALLSLPLYIFQLMIPDTLFTINNFFGLSSRNNSNSLLFNFTYLHATRNCGFMWEPGAFAGVLIICLYINTTIIQNYHILSRRNIVLILTVLTTFSTLGYLTLLFPLLAVIIYHRRYKYLLPLLISLPLLYNLDFLLPKLFKEQAQLNSELDKTQYATDDSRVSVSRSASIAIDFASFYERPLMGYGVDFRTTSAKQIFDEYDENVIRSCGIMNLLLRFGLIGLCVYVYLIFRSFRHHSTKSAAVIFSILFFLVLFSNPIDNSPFLFSFFFWQRFDWQIANRPPAIPNVVSTDCLTTNIR